MELNTILNGDCLSLMKEIPNEYVDIIVTSPPYNKSKVGGEIVKSISYDKYNDAVEEHQYQTWQKEILAECFRILKQDGHMFYNHKNRYVNGVQISPLEWIMSSNFVVRQEIVWDRAIAGNIRGWRFWQVDERIYWLQKPDAQKKEIKSSVASLTNIWRLSPEQRKYTNHPCAYPISLADRCLNVEDDLEGKIVFDPFMGSGTTAIAAIRNKCNYLGIELSQDYIDIANERIKFELRNLKLF